MGILNKVIYLRVAAIGLCASVVFFHPPARSTADNPLGVVQATPYQLAAGGRDLTDVSIGSIKIGMTLQQVTNKLGKPNKISQILDPCTGQKSITLRYNKLIITILGERVLQIENSVFSRIIREGTSRLRAVNPLYQTGEGIKVGDPLSKAKRTYDRLLSTPASKDGGDLLYNKSADGILRFKSQQGRITSISIIVNDC
jgi:hypothetical protein